MSNTTPLSLMLEELSVDSGFTSSGVKPDCCLIATQARKICRRDQWGTVLFSRAYALILLSPLHLNDVDPMDDFYRWKRALHPRRLQDIKGRNCPIRQVSR